MTVEVDVLENPEVAFVFMFVIGIVLFIAGLVQLKHKRLVENIPTSKIRSLAMGLVEIFGAVIHPKEHLLKSPFANRDCVYYKYTIEEYRTHHTKHGTHHYWQTIETGMDAVPFYLKDETGEVLVDSRGAAVEIPRTFQHDTHMGTMPKTLSEFIRTKSKPFSFSLGGFNINLGARRRYTEYIIPPSEKLYILGTAGSNPYTANVLSKEHTDEIMVQKGKFEKFYLISNKPEKDLLKVMNLKLWGGLILGVIFIVISVAYFSVSVLGLPVTNTTTGLTGNVTV